MRGNAFATAGFGLECASQCTDLKGGQGRNRDGICDLSYDPAVCFLPRYLWLECGWLFGPH
jgi:hypothetical protein